MVKSQETQGLLSIRVRNIRLSRVASFIKPNSVILDLACGAGYLKSFLPTSCKYYGVDRVLPPGYQEKPNFISLDLLRDDSIKQIQKKFQIKPDYITCVAFLEHISDPIMFLSKYKGLFDEKGILVGTTPHPIGKRIHEMFAMIGLLSKEAAHEHKSFLNREDLSEIASLSGGNLIFYKRFLLGMNQLFIIQYV